MAIMYYVVKYISKNEQSLHSKLAIAAAIRVAQTLDNKSNTAAGKQMIQKVYNKIESHREVGLPEAISHLLKFPDHYTDATFSNINTTHLLIYMKRSVTQDVRSHVMPDERRRSAHTENDAEGIDSEIIVSDHRYQIINIFDDYRYRGVELATYCLYDYSSMYVKRKSQEGIPFSLEHPQRAQYSQAIRANGYATPNLLGKILHLNPQSSEKCDREDFYCIVVGLFVPWGMPDIEKPSESSWEEHYNCIKTRLSPRVLRYIDNVNLLYKSKEESRLDRLQMLSVSVRPEDFDDEMQDSDLMTEHEDDASESCQYGSFEDFAANLRNVQNTVDLYMLEALDASQDFGYFDVTQDCESMDVDAPPVRMEAAQTQSSIHWISVATFGKAKTMFGKHIDPSTKFFDDDASVPVIPSVSIRESTYDATVDAIVRQYSLNCEQIRALSIVARHAKDEERQCPQLLMGLFGEGGTGKSRLIEAIQALFQFRSRSEELVVTATTGSAAYNIGGTTLHSAMGIPVEYGDGQSKRKVSQHKLAEWANRRYLIIDEVSMLDRSNIIKLETQLKKLTSNTTALLGGMNIVFCGDFLQLPTCNSQDLFIRDSSKYQRGNDLWRSLNVAVILKEQMRQADDPVWAALLQRVRLRRPTDEDIALLNTRVGAPLPSVHKPAIIVRRHNVRKATNNVKLVQESKRTGVPITYCIAHVVKKQKMQLNEIYALSYKEN